MQSDMSYMNVCRWVNQLICSIHSQNHFSLLTLFNNWKLVWIRCKRVTTLRGNCSVHATLFSRLAVQFQYKCRCNTNAMQCSGSITNTHCTECNNTSMHNLSITSLSPPSKHKLTQQTLSDKLPHPEHSHFMPPYRSDNLFAQ